MQDYLIIDTSCLYMTYAYLPHSIGVDNGLNGSIIFIRSMKKNYPNTKLILVLDGSIEGSREINEDYKAGRADKSGLYKNFNDFLRIASKHGNVEAIIRSKDEEADKVIALLAEMYATKGSVCIYSKDKDFWQLVGRTNINVSNKYIGKGKGFEYVTEDIVKDKFGVNPDKLVFFRMLKGDPSDNLKPPIPRLQSKKIIELVDNIDLNLIDIEDGLSEEYLVKLAHDIKDEKFKGQLLGAKKDIIDNFRIMDLTYGVRNNKELKESAKKLNINCDSNMYMSLCEKYNC